MTDTIVLHVTRAEQSAQPVPKLELHVDRRAPDFFDEPYIPTMDFLWKQRAYYAGEAEAIAAALHQTLPGGLYDQLLARLLLRAASHLVVPYQDARLIDRVEESPRYREALDEIARREEIIVALTHDMENLERDVCGDNERAAHQTDGYEPTTIEHLRAHLQAYLASMHYHPLPDDNWAARVAWLVAVQAQVEVLVREMFPGSHAGVAIHLYHGNDEAEAQQTCREQGFELKHSSDEPWCVWYKHDGPNADSTGEVSLFLDQPPLFETPGND